MNILSETPVLKEPIALLLALALLPILLLLQRRQRRLGHPLVALAVVPRSMPPLAYLARALLVVAWLSLTLAAARPQMPVKQGLERQTRDIVINVDVSTSMSLAVEGDHPETSGREYQRIDAARDAVCKFIAARQGDRIALMEFSEKSFFLSPLTNHLPSLLKKCLHINDQLLGGTNFQGPFEGYPYKGAIQAPLDHFTEMGQAASKVILIVTDGEAPINEKRSAELARQITAQGVKLYVLGVGKEWTSGTANRSTEPLRRLVERVQGHTFAANDKEAFDRAMREIDAMETSNVLVEKPRTYEDVYQYFTLAALVTVLLYLVTISITREST